MTADTGAVAGQGIWCLWNPSSDRPIWLISWTFEVLSATATFRPLLDRFTTRGTPGTTVTPDIDNDYENYVAPASGCLLDLGLYSGTAPVTAGGQTAFIMRWQTSAAQGEAPFIFVPPKPILIPPGDGFGATVAGNVVCSQGDVTVEWCE